MLFSIWPARSSIPISFYQLRQNTFLLLVFSVLGQRKGNRKTNLMKTVVETWFHYLFRTNFAATSFITKHPKKLHGMSWLIINILCIFPNSLAIFRNHFFSVSMFSSLADVIGTAGHHCQHLGLCKHCFKTTPQSTF